MKLLIAAIVIVAVIVIFQASFPQQGRPRSQAYGPSGAAT